MVKSITNRCDATNIPRHEAHSLFGQVFVILHYVFEIHQASFPQLTFIFKSDSGSEVLV